MATDRVDAAFAAVPREWFLPPDRRHRAAYDGPIDIGHGQTCSQPRTVANMLRLLDVHAGDRVLDVGSGSGWTTALLAHLTGPDGHVLGLEVVPELVAFGAGNLARGDQSQRDHRSAERLLGLGVRVRRGPETVAGQDQSALGPGHEREVALPLVDLLRGDELPARRVGLVHGAMHLRLGGALRVPEAGAVDHPVDGERAVGRVHHVRQPGDRRQRVHGVAEPDQGVPQVVPLSAGQRAIDRGLRVHPRIDHVLHREVVRRAHQVLLHGPQT